MLISLFNKNKYKIFLWIFVFFTILHVYNSERQFFNHLKFTYHVKNKEIFSHQNYQKIQEFNENQILIKETLLLKEENNIFTLYIKDFYPNGNLKKVVENYFQTNQLHFIRNYNQYGVVYEGVTYNLQEKKIGDIKMFSDEGFIQETIFYDHQDDVFQILEYLPDGKLLSSFTHSFDSHD
ncbi:hypothetical protein [Candidatus Phytoplasma melaleucae]|uniref:Effector n=2 Tax=Candidatus Phytoplasma melaleucae TaxID=2982630 RepID=A0ABT9DDX7_9MOLU|nr:hypothetical protein ['Melaleuca sp.' phytoplasma]MDO8167887.1 hypothetical protein ['Melaleuca sp.' phytoplasma]